MKLDLKKWNAKRIEVEGAIRTLKAVLRSSGYMGTWREWASLADLSSLATNLYMLRAELRGEGRLHATKTIEYIWDSRECKTVLNVVEITREDQRKRVFGGKALEWREDLLVQPIEQSPPSST